MTRQLEDAAPRPTTAAPPSSVTAPTSRRARQPLGPAYWPSRPTATCGRQPRRDDHPQRRLDGYEHTRLADWRAHAAFRDALLEGFAAPNPTGTASSNSPTPTAAPRPCSSTAPACPTAPAAAGWWSSTTSPASSPPSSAPPPGPRSPGGWPTRSEPPHPDPALRRTAALQARRSPRRGRPGNAGALHQTIVNQVEAMKNLVDAFRDYARLPSPQMTPIDLNAWSASAGPL